MSSDTKKPKKEKFDPVKMAERAISSNFDSSVFDKFDDSHIKRAKNFYEFCTSEDFLKTTIFPKQLEIGLLFFGEYCPRCSTPDYIKTLFNQKFIDIRQNVVMLEHGVCPKCSVTQTELFTLGELQAYDELDACCGRRAGKTILASLIAAYQLHRFLMVKNLTTFYPGIISGQKFFMLFVAVNKGQAEDTVWAAFNGRIRQSPWFNNYHEFLKVYGKKNGLEALVEIKDTFILYRHKNIEAQVITPNIRTVRGRTTIFTSCDELSWLDAGTDGNGNITNSEETHNGLAQSNKTVRGSAAELRSLNINNVPTAIDVNISSPYSANDIVMRLVRSSLTVPSILGYQLSTWEVNPYQPESSFADEKRKNLKAFLRDFAARPTLGDEYAFFDDEDSVKKAFSKDMHNKVAYSYAFATEDDGHKTLWLKARATVKDNIPRVMALDPGESDNSFALVIASLNKTGIVVDAVLECQPQKHDDGSVSKVNFPKMFAECIVPLVNQFNVRLVVSDRWQSTYITQAIKSKKVRAETKTLRHSDFVEIRSAWYDGKVKFPMMERPLDDFLTSHEQLEVFTKGKPVLRLASQTTTVREVGLKVVKPLNGTDDIFRAAALCLNALLDKHASKTFGTSGDGVNQSQVRSMGMSAKAMSTGRYEGSGRSVSSSTGSIRVQGAVLRPRTDPTGILSSRERSRPPISR